MTIYTKIMDYAGRTLYRAAVCAGILVCAASCRDDDLLPGADTDGRIAFMLAESVVPVSRAVTGYGNDSTAVVTPVSIPLHVASDTIGLTFAMEPNCEVPVAGKPLTRGIQFDEHTNRVTEFHVTAFRDNGSTFFDEGDEYITLDVSGVGTTKYHWPQGKLSFCAYTTSKGITWVDGFNPVFNKNTAESGLSGSFTYALPKTDNKDDAINQPDLVFAMSPDHSKTTPSTPVELLFHHALSAIVFKVGTMPEDVTLQSITIENVYSSGSCNMTSGKKSGDSEEGDYENVVFTWELSGEQTWTYTQTLKGQKAEKDDLFGKSEEFTFLLLPQQMANNTQFKLEFKIGEEAYTLTHAFKDVVDAWWADTKYIFVIGLNGEVDVDVDDKVVDAVKQDLQIRNTGIATGYIRAAIVGYWVDKDTGDIVAAWDEENDGNFEWGDDWETYWEKGTDGFYYHKAPVEHNGLTSPLFETYTLKEDLSGHDNQTLKLSIVAQIVIADKVKEAWPNCPLEGLAKE